MDNYNILGALLQGYLGNDYALVSVSSPPAGPVRLMRYMVIHKGRSRYVYSQCSEDPLTQDMPWLTSWAAGAALGIKEMCK